MTTREGQRRGPVRMAHLGLGAFHRAHQAWYTEQANAQAGTDQWCYESFTGRAPRTADLLEQQDCRYHVVVRDVDGDRPQLISAIARASHGADVRRLCDVVAASSTALVTLTITEGAYGPDGGSSDDPERRAVATARWEELRTPVARLTAALRARWEAGGAPIALTSCDNLRGNGAVLASRIAALAADLDPQFLRWLDRDVSFVSTMVDRITPALSAGDDIDLPPIDGVPDRMPVVTEPASEWVLAGEFPGGRPQWEVAGAQFVADVRPYEERKLWILNAGHSLLAYLGRLRGHETVAAAVRDPECRRALEALWDDAAPVLDLPDAAVIEARQRVIERWSNPRIEHRLDQIGRGGLHKLRERVGPVLVRWRDERRGLPVGELNVLAAWIAAVRGGVTDDTSLPALAVGTADDAIALAVSRVAPELDGDEAVLAGIRAAVATASPS